MLFPMELTARMVILGAEICKVKLHPDLSRDRAKDLIGMIDGILPEFIALWNTYNYPKGSERFAGYLTQRREELARL